MNPRSSVMSRFLVSSTISTRAIQQEKLGAGFVCVPEEEAGGSREE
jgi:hypothetical protein